MNLVLCDLGGILDHPKPLGTVLEGKKVELTLSSFNGFINSTQTSLSNGTNGTISQELELTRGITIFAPNDAAFVDVSETLASLANNTPALLTILKNHVSP